MRARYLRQTIRAVAMTAAAGLIAAACGFDDGLVAEVDISQPPVADADGSSDADSVAETPAGTDSSAGASAAGEVEGLVVGCPAVAADFAGQEMAQPGFVGEDLRCADFTGAVFAQGALSGSDVSGADFTSTTFSQTRWVNVTVVGANFTGAAFAQVSIQDSNFTGALLGDADVLDVDWSNTICPNGVNSDDLGGTCIAGLDPVAVTIGVGAGALGTGDESGAGSAPLAAESPRDACTGFFTGTYRGDDQGPFAIELRPGGEVLSAFVNRDSVRLGSGNVLDAIADAGLVLGTDITINGGQIEISPGALRVTVEGLRLGNLEVELQPIGTIDESGTVQAIARTGALVSGSFDWATCSGSGEWINIGLAGTWQVGLGATVLSLDPGDCAAAGYVGVGRDTGAIELDLDAACLADAVADTDSLADDELSAEVGIGDGFVAYTLSESVLFAFGSAELGAEARMLVEAVGRSIEADWAGLPITVIGHTDSIGTAGYNFQLSRLRADAVAAVLADVVSADIDQVGLGESRPIQPNALPDGTDNPSGRNQNRRVEIVVTSG